jgi:hypothetical protein
MRGRPTKPEALKVLERRKRVAAEFVCGVAHWEMAREEGVDAAQISRDLAWIRKQYTDSCGDCAETKLVAEVAKLNEVEREAWKAWESSKQDAELRHAKIVRAGDVERSEASKREESQVGDARFLAEIRACIRQRCELFGLLAVQQHEHKGDVHVVFDDEWHKPPSIGGPGDPPAPADAGTIPGSI